MLSYAVVVYSFLFYFIHSHSVMFIFLFSTLLLSALHLCLGFYSTILFYWIFLYFFFGSVLLSNILLTFILFHVQLCCSILFSFILFMHYCSVMFFKSILFILVPFYSVVLFYSNILYPLYWSDLSYLFFLLLWMNHICQAIKCIGKWARFNSRGGNVHPFLLALMRYYRECVIVKINDSTNNT